jgi:acyl-CoA synthetase (AMP-forming)/AMP-acid ligase II
MNETLLEILSRIARSRPDAIAITWLRDGEDNEVDVSFGELDRRISRISSALPEQVNVGDRVLIFGDNEPEYVAGFLGCLHAGVIAVPVACPRGNRSLCGLESIAGDCGASAGIIAGVSPRTRARLGASEALRHLRWLDLDALPDKSDNDPILPVDFQEIAYLQYTSGSTGSPRGVMITHQNLVANQRMMAQLAGHDSKTLNVGWLPLFHDMGLTAIAQTLYVGGRSVMIPPRFFMQKPLRWLSAISRYGATSCAAPDFAYELCARTIDPSKLAGLNLNTWRIAISGGEAVRASTLRHFAEKFGPHGFRPEVWLPCYGLAEATCFVTGPKQGRAPSIVEREPGRPLVGCGFSPSGGEIAIVNPDTRVARAEGEIGEVWVRGPSVGRGYWGRPQETAETFAATLPGDPRPWLRTGDLGFTTAGELFIAGRLKDLIIIHGSNHDPHAIELTVRRCNPAFAEARGAAFAIEHDSAERLAIVQEVVRAVRNNFNADEAIADIREAVSAAHGVQPWVILLVCPATLPITSSGKIQRGECRRRMEAGELIVLARAGGESNPS